MTLDGTLMLVDDNCGRPPEDSILWNIMVDHQLMCLSKLDVTGNGVQEVSLSFVSPFSVSPEVVSGDRLFLGRPDVHRLAGQTGCEVPV